MAADTTSPTSFDVGGGEYTHCPSYNVQDEESLLTFAQKAGYLYFNPGTALILSKARNTMGERILSELVAQWLLKLDQAQAAETQRDTGWHGCMPWRSTADSIVLTAIGRPISTDLMYACTLREMQPVFYGAAQEGSYAKGYVY